MENKKTSGKKFTKMSFREAKKQDIFIFRISSKKTPSENMGVLLDMLSKHRMKLNSDTQYPKNYDPSQVDRKFRIADITMMGDPFVISNKLSQIRIRLIDYINDYIKSEESYTNRHYEITNCRFLIREFLYKISFSEPTFYDPNKRYEVRFRTKAGLYDTIVMPTSNIVFSERAQAEIADHYNARSSFLNNLVEYLDVKLDELFLLEYKKDLVLVPQINKIKEKQLLEVWLGLRLSGFLDHVNTRNEIAKHRKIFFESFNLQDRNFNSNHNNLKKNKTDRGIFLEGLMNTVKKLPRPLKK